MDSISLSLLTNPYLSYPTSFFLGVSVCRLLPVASWKKPSVQPCASATSRGTSPSSIWRSVLGRAYREDEFSTHTSSDNKYSNRENLIELFKRIQIEISESRSEDYAKSSETFTDNDSSIETSVLEFLQQSNRKSKGKASNLKHTSEESNHKRRTAKKEKPTPTSESLSTTNFSRPPSNFVKKSPIPSLTPLRSNEIVVNYTSFSRLPSNFVKKSPIPSLTPLRSNEIVVNYGEDSNSEAGEESSKIEAMKLSELKELAKQRGLRGYSKLKKSELVQLLKS